MAKRGPKPKRKEVIWSPEIAYGVGLMATDGCLSSNGRHLAFTSKDLELIENVRKCFEVTAKVFLKRSGRKEIVPTYFHLQWGDKTLFDFLLAVGVTPRKSLTLGSLIVPDEYFFDFLRGSLGGDGSFYSYFDKRWKSSFMFYLSFSSASEAHTSWLQKNIERLALVKGHITHVGGKNKTTMHNLRYAKRESLILLSKMYGDSSGLCLTRKRLKIVDALSIVGITAPF